MSVKFNEMKLSSFINTDNLNPMKCDLSFINCRTFLYYVFGTIMLFAVLILLTANKYSGFSLLMSTLCLCTIFVVCSMVLLNLCSSKSPTIYHYITIGGSILSMLVILLFFSRSKK